MRRWFLAWAAYSLANIGPAERSSKTGTGGNQTRGWGSQRDAEFRSSEDVDSPRSEGRTMWGIYRVQTCSLSVFQVGSEALWFDVWIQANNNKHQLDILISNHSMYALVVYLYLNLIIKKQNFSPFFCPSISLVHLPFPTGQWRVSPVQSYIYNPCSYDLE